MGRRVAIYARVSTEHEAQLSALDNQVQYYDNILLLHPDWILYKKYIDEGITGTSVNKRKNFMKMIEDAEAGCFDLIVTREVSRFARNTVDTLQETRKLKKIGVEVYFIEDNIWTMKDDDGELKLTIMATLAQNESKKTSQRVKAGQKISFQNGVLYGTGNILGYDRLGKEAVINEKQAEVVKLIYKLFLDGMGTQKIKFELEKRNIPTATGLKEWNFATISRILQNPFYCGKVVYRKEYVSDYLEQKKRKNKGEVEQIIVEGKHKPIISKEDFEKVQKLIKSHSVYKPELKKRCVVGAPTDMWSKKLVCECGSQLNRRVYSRNSTGEIIYGYYCYRQKNDGSIRKRQKLGLDTDGYCDVPIIQEWKLKLMGTLVLKKLIAEKDSIRKMAIAGIDDDFTKNKIEDNIEKEIKVINNKIKSIQDKKENLLSIFLDSMITKEQYKKRLEEFENDEKKLNNQIDEMQKSKNVIDDNLKYKIKAMKENIISKLDYELYGVDNNMIDNIVEKIVVHNNRYEWKLNLISDVTKYSSNKTELGVLWRTVVITEDIVRKYNKSVLHLKKVFQKEPIIVDIYM